MRLPAVLSSVDLPDQELQCARLDGELFALDTCFCPIDEIEQPHHRAAAMALTLPDRLIAEQRSAAWIYGALNRAPSTHELCAEVTARSRPASLERYVLREVVIDAIDIRTISNLRVTSPVRTVVDLARFSSRFEEEEQVMVARLMTIGRFDVTECRQLLDRRRNLPGKRRALDRIRSAAAHPIHVVDSVDSPHRVQHPIQMRGVAHLEYEPAQRKALA
jgi:hypothetical protein